MGCFLLYLSVINQNQPKMNQKLETMGKVSIKAFTDPNQENMGLEKYNYVVFPNTFQVETLAAIEQNGKTRYLTGLNEYAPEVKQIKVIQYAQK